MLTGAIVRRLGGFRSRYIAFRLLDSDWLTVLHNDLVTKLPVELTRTCAARGRVAHREESVPHPVSYLSGTSHLPLSTAHIHAQDRPLWFRSFNEAYRNSEEKTQLSLFDGLQHDNNDNNNNNNNNNIRTGTEHLNHTLHCYSFVTVTVSIATLYAFQNYYLFQYSLEYYILHQIHVRA